MALQTKYQANPELSDFGLAEERPQILFTGPYVNNYSYAKLNRGLASALSEVTSDYWTKIWREPAVHIDRVMKPGTEEQINLPSGMLTDSIENTTINVFNHFPVDQQAPFGIDKLPSGINLQYFAWEESKIPEFRINEMNKHLHGIMAISTFTKQILMNNGIQVPVAVVPCGIDDRFFKYKPREYELATDKSFKFLHISSARQRKGVDILLKAFFEEFDSDDDVCLVIKSFPGPDNVVNDLIGKLNNEYKQPPEVIHIFDPDLTEEEIIDLNHTADAAIYPSRSEGFGLPIAEAMAVGTPVITTGYGGQLEFCNDENALLLDYEITDATSSEMLNIGAKWAEPSQKNLQSKMRLVFEEGDTEFIRGKVKAAQQAASKLTWKNAAKKALAFMDEVSSYSQFKGKNLAIISEFNSIGGVAEYSFDLYNPILSSFKNTYFLANSDCGELVGTDNENVLRCWETGSNKIEPIVEALKQRKCDILHIQHHSAQISSGTLAKLINKVRDELPETKIYLTPHDASSDNADYHKIEETLTSANKIFVHKANDRKSLAKLGLENLVDFPLPFDTYPLWDNEDLQTRLGISNSRPVIATHGICSHHKGLLETARAVAKLKQNYPNILWLAMNAVSINNLSSTSTMDSLREVVDKLKISDNVRIFPKFLDQLEVVTLLQSADIGLLAYNEVGESASAAVRKFLASGTPTIVTDIPMMSELASEVYKIPDNSPDNIAEAIDKLWTDKSIQESIAEKALKTSSTHSWEVMGRKLLEYYANPT